MNYTVIVVGREYNDFDIPDLSTELEARVNEHIRSGWKPLGGVSISQTETPLFGQVIMAQAMIK